VDGRHDRGIRADQFQARAFQAKGDIFERQRESGGNQESSSRIQGREVKSIASFVLYLHSISIHYSTIVVDSLSIVELHSSFPQQCLLTEACIHDPSKFVLLFLWALAYGDAHCANQSSDDRWSNPECRTIYNNQPLPLSPNYPTGICHTFQKSERKSCCWPARIIAIFQIQVAFCLLLEIRYILPRCSSNALRVHRENQMNANISINQSLLYNLHSRISLVTCTWSLGTSYLDDNTTTTITRADSPKNLKCTFSPILFYGTQHFRPRTSPKLLFNNTYATSKHSKRK
jgi:hypothetical protein